MQHYIAYNYQTIYAAAPDLQTLKAKIDADWLHVKHGVPSEDLSIMPATERLARMVEDWGGDCAWRIVPNPEASGQIADIVEDSI